MQLLTKLLKKSKIDTPEVEFHPNSEISKAQELNHETGSISSDKSSTEAVVSKAPSSTPEITPTISDTPQMNNKSNSQNQLQTISKLVRSKPVAHAFDRATYLERNGDVRDANMDPEAHYLGYGMKENRLPNMAFSSSYVSNQLRQCNLLSKNILEHYQDSNLHQRIRVIFVSHDASRTGAPAIILRLISMFSKLKDIECITILDEGGDRLEEFRYVSQVYTMDKQRYNPKATHEGSFEELSRLFGPNGAFSTNPPVVALVNSAESLRIAKILKELGIPIISLLHEFATYYKPEHFAEFVDISEHVILPSEFIMKLSIDYAQVADTKLSVRGQGLLDDGFGKLDRQACRDQLLRDLRLPEDSFIVLNVGTMDQRKGIDHFVYAASLFVERYPEIKNVFFVWYGAGDKSSGSAYNFAKREIERYDLEDRVLFMPATANIEPIFMGSNLFFLSARADPFPCVIHEALACALPVIAFRNGGGAPELIGDDCGTILELGDISSVVDTVHKYINESAYYAAHSSNAKNKIAEHWKYQDYFNYVHSVMNAHAKKKIPLVKSKLADPIDHLVLANESLKSCDAFLKMLKNENFEAYVFNIINLKKSPELNDSIQLISKAKRDYFISNPTENKIGAIKDLVRFNITDIKPSTLTVVDVYDCIDFDFLSVSSFTKRLVISDSILDVEKMYAIGLYFDEIWTFDDTIVEKIASLNPLIAAKIKVFSSLE